MNITTARSKIRQLTLVMAALTFIASPFAHGQTEDLSRRMDRVKSAVAAALADAEAGKAPALRTSLKAANEAWANLYKGYRSYATGHDPDWIAKMDGVHANFMNATNALTPLNNVPRVAQILRDIATTLDSLSNQLGLPDLDAAVNEVDESLQQMSKTMQSAQGKALTPAMLDSITEDWNSASAAWDGLTQSLIDTNTFGFGESDLKKFRNLVALQNATFQAIGNALGSANVRQGVADIRTALEQLDTLRAQINQGNPTGSGGDPKPQKSGPALIRPRGLR